MDMKVTTCEENFTDGQHDSFFKCKNTLATYVSLVLFGALDLALPLTRSTKTDTTADTLNHHFNRHKTFHNRLDHQRKTIRQERSTTPAIKQGSNDAILRDLTVPYDSCACGLQPRHNLGRAQRHHHRRTYPHNTGDQAFWLR